jgi:hypothetical protein
MSSGYNNVYFVGVARIATQAYVVAAFSYHSETDVNAIKQVLEQPNMQMSPGKHYTFTVGTVAWHLIAGIQSIKKLRTLDSLTYFSFV